MMRVKNPRRTLPMLFPLALVGALAYACADPHGDLEDFKDRSSGAAPGGESGAGGAPSTGGAGGAPATQLADISGTFVFACANTFFSDIDTAIRFRAAIELTLAGGGEAGAGPAGGTLGLVVQPIKLGAATPDEVVGGPITIDAPAQVDQTGQFAFTLQRAEVDASANTSGNFVVLTNVAYRAAIVDENNFCARFGAIVEAPPLGPLDYNDNSNSCVGVRVTDVAAAPPVVTKAQLDACKRLMASTPAPLALTFRPPGPPAARAAPPAPRPGARPQLATAAGTVSGSMQRGSSCSGRSTWRDTG